MKTDYFMGLDMGTGSSWMGGYRFILSSVPSTWERSVGSTII